MFSATSLNVSIVLTLKLSAECEAIIRGAMCRSLLVAMIYVMTFDDMSNGAWTIVSYRCIDIDIEPFREAEFGVNCVDRYARARIHTHTSIYTSNNLVICMEFAEGISGRKS